MRKLTTKEVNEIAEIFKATIEASNTREATWDSETSFIPTRGVDAGFPVDIHDIEVEGARILINSDVYSYNASAGRGEYLGYLYLSSSEMVNECRAAWGVGNAVRVLEPGE